MGLTNYVLTLAVVVLLYLGQVVLAQGPGNKDIEETGAFLVKLQPGEKSTRADVSDDWQFTPLISEAQTRGEATPLGNWWYLSPKIGATRTRSADAKSDWDRAYELYASRAASSRAPGTKSPLSKRGVEPQTIEFIEPDLGFFCTCGRCVGNESDSVAFCIARQSRRGIEPDSALASVPRGWQLSG